MLQDRCAGNTCGSFFPPVKDHASHYWIGFSALASMVGRAPTQAHTIASGRRASTTTWHVHKRVSGNAENVHDVVTC